MFELINQNIKRKKKYFYYYLFKILWHKKTNSPPMPTDWNYFHINIKMNKSQTKYYNIMF